MNRDIIHTLLNRYEENITVLYNSEHDELFKWNALKTFQAEWFAPKEKYPDFISRFNAATGDFDIFIDNSRMHPRNGVVKLYEKNPAEVERLFVDVLFAEDDGNLELRQQHMDTFMEGMEKLREEYYPANWSFKQDRHAASTYLAMYAPSENYVYKYSEAESMAVYGEYGCDLGAGAYFSLANYYRMCDEIVENLKEHTSLLDKHFSKLQEKHYREESLHLLAFDVIYCCRTYGYYTGITHQSKQTSIKQAKIDAKNKVIEAEKQARRDEISFKINELELQRPDISDISLLNTEVSYSGKGTGTIISQELNKIKVRFADKESTFILDKKFPMRPRFENDEEVVEAFSEYTAIGKQIESLQRELNRI